MPDCKIIVNTGIILVYFQAKRWEDFQSKIRGSYWTALKMNWKVWTPFQFININFVPVQVCISLTSYHSAKDEPHIDPNNVFPVFLCLLYFLLAVQSAVCQHGCLVLVRLPCICEEMTLPVIVSQTANLEETCFFKVTQLLANSQTVTLDYLLTNCYTLLLFGHKALFVLKEHNKGSLL